MEPPSILVVDDDDDIREVMADLITDLGYRVSTARNGLEALQLLRAATVKPCLVLLDLMMPVMNGFEFIAERARDPSLAAVPVVILSAHGNLSQEQRDALGERVLPKPVPMDALLELIKRHCSAEG